MQRQGTGNPARGFGGAFPNSMSMTETLDFSALPALRRHVAVVHHVPGRIRLRIGASILAAGSGIDTAALRHLLDSMTGIIDVRMNAAAASLAIQYDPKSIPPADWETLLQGEAELVHALVRRWMGNCGWTSTEFQTDRE